MTYLCDVNKSNKPQIICGDFNRIVSEIDGYNPDLLRKTKGFLPEEKWFNDFLNSGFITSDYFNKKTRKLYLVGI